MFGFQLRNMIFLIVLVATTTLTVCEIASHYAAQVAHVGQIVAVPCTHSCKSTISVGGALHEDNVKGLPQSYANYPHSMWKVEFS